MKIGGYAIGIIDLGGWMRLKGGPNDVKGSSLGHGGGIGGPNS